MEQLVGAIMESRNVLLTALWIGINGHKFGPATPSIGALTCMNMTEEPYF